MVTTRPPRIVPWGRAELVVLIGSVVGAALLVVWAWFGVNGRVTVRDQIPWINVAVGGVVVAGGANAIVLASVRRRIGAARSHVVAELRRILPEPAAEPESLGPVTAARMTWYHRPGCPLMRSKAPAASGPSARTGRTPCPTCIAEEHRT